MKQFDIYNTKILQGQVWLVRLNKEYNNGSIECKPRPCVIISNSVNNYFSNVIQIIPITSSREGIKGPYQTAYHIEDADPVLQVVLCEQLTTIQKKSLIKYLYTLSDEVMNNIKNSVKIQLNIKE